MDKSINIITIDGPSSSGKSSVGREFAHKIGFQFIDTGAIYRAGALDVIRKKINLDDKEAVVRAFRDIKIDFKEHDDHQRVFLHGEDVTELLHSPEVTRMVPVTSAIGEVREVTKGLQKEIGQREPTVMVGRDIGTEIFPEAKLKFFITASAEVRAQRRYEQQKLIRPDISLNDILNETKQRDKMDTERSASPMRIPEDAVVIDTSKLSKEEAVEGLMKEFNKISNNYKVTRCIPRVWF